MSKVEGENIECSCFEWIHPARCLGNFPLLPHDQQSGARICFANLVNSGRNDGLAITPRSFVEVAGSIEEERMRSSGRVEGKEGASEFLDTTRPSRATYLDSWRGG